MFGVECEEAVRGAGARSRARTCEMATALRLTSRRTAGRRTNVPRRGARATRDRSPAPRRVCKLSGAVMDK